MAALSRVTAFARGAESVELTPAVVADVRACFAGAGGENASLATLALAVLRKVCGALGDAAGSVRDVSSAAEAGAAAADALQACGSAALGAKARPQECALQRYGLCRRLVGCGAHAAAHAQALRLLSQLWPDERVGDALPPPPRGEAAGDRVTLVLGAALCLAGAAAELARPETLRHAIRVAASLPPWLRCASRPPLLSTAHVTEPGLCRPTRPLGTQTRCFAPSARRVARAPLWVVTNLTQKPQAALCLAPLPAFEADAVAAAEACLRHAAASSASSCKCVPAASRLAAALPRHARAGERVCLVAAASLAAAGHAEDAIQCVEEAAACARLGGEGDAAAPARLLSAFAADVASSAGAGCCAVAAAAALAAAALSPESPAACDAAAAAVRACAAAAARRTTEAPLPAARILALLRRSAESLRRSASPACPCAAAPLLAVASLLASIPPLLNGPDGGALVAAPTPAGAATAAAVGSAVACAAAAARVLLLCTARSGGAEDAAFACDAAALAASAALPLIATHPPALRAGIAAMRLASECTREIAQACDDDSAGARAVLARVTLLRPAAAMSLALLRTDEGGGEEAAALAMATSFSLADALVRQADHASPSPSPPAGDALYPATTVDALGVLTSLAAALRAHHEHKIADVAARFVRVAGAEASVVAAAASSRAEGAGGGGGGGAGALAAACSSLPLFGFHGAELTAWTHNGPRTWSLPRSVALAQLAAEAAEAAPGAEGNGCVDPLAAAVARAKHAALLRLRGGACGAAALAGAAALQLLPVGSVAGGDAQPSFAHHCGVAFVAAAAALCALDDTLSASASVGCEASCSPPRDSAACPFSRFAAAAATACAAWDSAASVAAGAPPDAAAASAACVAAEEAAALAHASAWAGRPLLLRRCSDACASMWAIASAGGHDASRRPSMPQCTLFARIVAAPLSCGDGGGGAPADGDAVSALTAVVSGLSLGDGADAGAAAPPAEPCSEDASCPLRLCDAALSTAASEFGASRVSSALAWASRAASLSSAQPSAASPPGASLLCCGAAAQRHRRACAAVASHVAFASCAEASGSAAAAGRALEQARASVEASDADCSSSAACWAARAAVAVRRASLLRRCREWERAAGVCDAADDALLRLEEAPPSQHDGGHASPLRLLRAELCRVRADIDRRTGAAHRGAHSYAAALEVLRPLLRDDHPPPPAREWIALARQCASRCELGAAKCAAASVGWGAGAGTQTGGDARHYPASAAPSALAATLPHLFAALMHAGGAWGDGEGEGRVCGGDAPRWERAAALCFYARLLAAAAEAAQPSLPNPEEEAALLSAEPAPPHAPPAAAPPVRRGRSRAKAQPAAAASPPPPPPPPSPPPPPPRASKKAAPRASRVAPLEPPLTPPPPAAAVFSSALRCAAGCPPLYAAVCSAFAAAPASARAAAHAALHAAALVRAALGASPDAEAEAAVCAAAIDGGGGGVCALHSAASIDALAPLPPGSNIATMTLCAPGSSLGVDPESPGAQLLISRACACPDGGSDVDVVQRVPPRPCGSPPVSPSLAELSRLFAESDACRSAAVDTPARKSAWWGARLALDARLAHVLADLDASDLRGWRCMLRADALPPGACAVAVWEEASRLAASVAPALAHADARSAAALFSLLAASLAAGAMTEAEAAEVVGAQVGGASDQPAPRAHAAWCDAAVARLCAAAGVAQPSTPEPPPRAQRHKRAPKAAPVAPAPARAASPPACPPPPPSTLFVMLDARLCCVPWESLPGLRGQRWSRLPSARLLSPSTHAPCDAALSRDARRGGCAPLALSLRRAHFLLNPSGDLCGTQATVAPLLARHAPGWAGLAGGPLSCAQRVGHSVSLSSAPLFLFFGHGAGEQHLPHPHRLRRRGDVAARLALLMGCSSGALTAAGDFPPSGPALRYIASGCGALLGTLWDVTDRECDRFAVALLAGWEASGGAAHAGLASAAAACRLPSLTGAATVCYGVPPVLREGAGAGEEDTC